MKKGLILVFLTALVSGVSIFINAFGVKGINSTVFTFLKNSIVALLLISIIFGLKEFKTLKEVNTKDWLWLVLVGLVGGAIPFVMFFKGLQLSTGLVGSFIHKAMFIFVAILAVVFLKERLSWKVILPAVVLLGGNFLLLGITSFEFSAGTLLVIGATVFWSAENILSKSLLKRIAPKVLAFARLGFGSLFIMMYLMLTGDFSLIGSLNIGQVSWILVSAPFLLMYVLTWYTGLRDVNVTTATSVLLLGSPITLMLSYLFLGKALTVLQVSGIILLVAGVVSMTLLLESETKTHCESTTSTA